MISRRQEKLVSLYRHLAASYLQKEPLSKNGIVSVTRTELSENSDELTIYFSVWPDAEAKNMLKLLKNLKYGLRRHLAERTKIKFAPEIKFRLDESEKKRLAIEELLNKNK